MFPFERAGTTVERIQHVTATTQQQRPRGSQSRVRERFKNTRTYEEGSKRYYQSSSPGHHQKDPRTVTGAAILL